MLSLAMRSLWARRRTYSLVFVQLITGFFCLTLAAGVWQDVTAVTRRARQAAPPETIDTWLWGCRVGPVQAMLGALRQDPAVAGAAVIYSIGVDPGNQKVQYSGIDAATAALAPRQTAAGRWFTPADFQPAQGRPIPVVLGATAYPELGVGGSLPDFLGGRLEVIGRLRPGQLFWRGNGGSALDAIAAADQMVLMPLTLAQRNEERFPAERFPGFGQMLRLLVFPRRSPAEASAALERMLRDELHSPPLPAMGIPEPGSCVHSPPTTLAVAVQDYYSHNRDFLAVVAALAGVVLGVGLLGYSGVALVITERRTREFALRLAVGATNSDLARQVLGEMLALSLLAAAVAIPLAVLLAARAQLQVTGGVIAFTLAAGALEAAAAALAPMLTLLRRPPVYFIRGGR